MVSLSRFVCTDFSQPQLPVLGGRNVSCSGIGRMFFTWEFHLLFFFLKKEAQSTLFASAFFQVPSTRNSQYVRVAYFGEHVLNSFAFLT